VKGVLFSGVRVFGDGVQLLGGGVEPAVQLSVTELVYPFNAVIVPLKVVVWPRKMLPTELETVIWKSGVMTRLNCQMPRP
jgi:hypothetical protein